MEDELIVKGLYKNIGKREIIKNIDIRVQKGEIVGFIGPNGAGKSTTMKCIAGLYRANKGSITIHGYDLVKQQTKALQYIGVSIEEPALYPDLTGHEHFQLMKSWKKLSSKRVQEMEEFSGLQDSLKRRTSQYSMGMKQRLILSLALVQSPSLLLLDEPTNGLDPQAVFALRKTLEMVQKQGCGILISSHQLDELQKICHRFLFIEKGEIISCITKEEMNQFTLSYRLRVLDANVFYEKMRNFAVQVQAHDCIRIIAKDQKEFADFLNKSQCCKLPILDITKEDVTLEELYRRMYEEV